MSTRHKQSSGINRTPTRRTVVRTVTKPAGLVSHYPLSSVLVAYGVGLALGVAFVSFIGGPVTPLPSLRQRAELASENAGRHMRDAIAGVLPGSLSKHISS